MKLPRKRYYTLPEAAEILSRQSGEQITADTIIHWACHEDIQLSVIVEDAMLHFYRWKDHGDGRVEMVKQKGAEHWLMNEPVPVFCKYVWEIVRNGDSQMKTVESYLSMTDEDPLGFSTAWDKILSEEIRVTASDLVVLAPELDRMTNGDAPPNADPIDLRERRTLLAIIKALALEASLPLNMPNKAADVLAAIAAHHGVAFPKKSETVAKKLAEARDAD